MFGVTWIPVNTNDVGINLGPGECEIDIVGSSEFPSLFAALDDNFVYFRMRVNCNPIKNDRLQNCVWGIVIKDATDTPIFTVRVNPIDPTDMVQVYTPLGNNPFDSLNCQQVIVLGDNVIVTPAASNFGSTPDYFLDFKAPRTTDCFNPDPFEVNLIFCGFTSENENNINKEIPPPYGDNEALCGGEAPPPEAQIQITKTVVPTTPRACVTQDFDVTITVVNISGTQLDGLLLTDVINSEFVVVDPPGQNVFEFGPFDLGIGFTVTFEFTVKGFFEKTGVFAFNAATFTQGSEVLGTFVGPDITVSSGACRGITFL